MIWKGAVTNHKPCHPAPRARGSGIYVSRAAYAKPRVQTPRLLELSRGPLERKQDACKESSLVRRKYLATVGLKLCPTFI